MTKTKLRFIVAHEQPDESIHCLMYHIELDKTQSETKKVIDKFFNDVYQTYKMKDDLFAEDVESGKLQVNLPQGAVLDTIKIISGETEQKQFYKSSYSTPRMIMRNEGEFKVYNATYGMRNFSQKPSKRRGNLVGVSSLSAVKTYLRHSGYVDRAGLDKPFPDQLKVNDIIVRSFGDYYQLLLIKSIDKNYDDSLRKFFYNRNNIKRYLLQVDSRRAYISRLFESKEDAYNYAHRSSYRLHANAEIKVYEIKYPSHYTVITDKTKTHEGTSISLKDATILKRAATLLYKGFSRPGDNYPTWRYSKDLEYTEEPEKEIATITFDVYDVYSSGMTVTHMAFTGKTLTKRFLREKPINPPGAPWNITFGSAIVFRPRVGINLDLKELED